MTERVLVRVVCREHGEVMARVQQAEAGARYQARGPDIAVLPKPRAGLYGPTGKRVSRLPAAHESVDLALDDVDRVYTDGQLPAWCPLCGAWKFVGVERVRAGENPIKL